MSWVSGIHDRLTSSSLKPAASVEPRQLARMLPWVSTTPLGSLVEPEENWMKAVSSALTRCTLPAREMSSRSSTRKARRRRPSKVCCSPDLRGEGADALERAALGVDEGLAEAARDAQQLVAVLVADAERHRHRHDAAEDRRPERVDELLVVGEEQDQLVAAARADALQVIEDAERALVQLAEGDLARVVLAFEVGDACARRCGCSR